MSSRSRAPSRARSARPTTYSRSSTTTGSGSSARRAFRCDSALVALPGQSIDGIERVYSHAQALAQADEFLRARDWGNDDLQHGRRGPDDAEKRRAGRRRDRLAARRRALRPRDPGGQHPDRRREPDAVRDPRPRGDIARRALGHGGGRPAPDDAGLRGPKRARIAPPLSGDVRCARGQPLTPRVPPDAEHAMGVLVLGGRRRRCVPS